MSKSLGEIKEYIHNGELDGVLQELYVDEKSVPAQRIRYEHALDQFKELFGEKEVEIYSAAGRSEIGGNHTDHQNGKVLAASINLDAIGIVSKREDTMVQIKSEGYKMITLDLKDLGKVKEEEGTTRALIRGVANGIVKRGCQIGGFDAYVTSSVLSGSGLSSSAAFEVLIGNIFSGLYNNCKLNSVEIAQIGQEAENVYFGKPCGLMDQMACSVGGLIFIDFADPKNPVVKKVDVQFSKFHHSLCIVDTKGSHADLTDEYAAIPAEMKQVAAVFGKNLLCEVNEEEFMGKLAEVREKCGDRCVLRAMHWFEENRRVEAQVAALERDSIDDFKKKIKESGDSSYKFLQNVFSVKKLQEQSVSVALAVSERLLGEKGVCRVHGGGFAGTIQAFVPSEMVENYKKGMEAVFGEGSCHVLQIREDGGRKVI